MLGIRLGIFIFAPAVMKEPRGGKLFVVGLHRHSFLDDADSFRAQARYPKNASRRLPLPPAARPPRRPAGTGKFKFEKERQRLLFLSFSLIQSTRQSVVSYVDLLSDPSSRMPGKVKSLSKYHVVVIFTMYLSAVCSEKITRFRLSLW